MCAYDTQNAKVRGRTLTGEVLEDPGDGDRLDRLDERRSDRALVRPAGREDVRPGAGGVVAGAAQFGDAVGDPQPAGGTVALIRQADAAGVQKAHAVEHPVVLLVCVAGDDK